MRIIGKALYGSNNYHLDGPQSDKDYKLFIAPEFIDLYNGKDKYGIPFGFTEKDNISTMDFRKFDSLLRKGNVNTIEYLFSTELYIYDETFIPYFELARHAFEEGYVAYVWDYYFASAKGLVLNSIKRMNDCEESQRKATSRGFWMLNFISYLINNNYRITGSVWNCPTIYTYPRKIRYEEDAFTPIAEGEWLEMFEYLEIWTANNPNTKPNYILQDYNNQLMLCAQNTIATAIKKELEAR